MLRLRLCEPLPSSCSRRHVASANWRPATASTCPFRQARSPACRARTEAARPVFTIQTKQQLPTSNTVLVIYTDIGSRLYSAAGGGAGGRGRGGGGGARRRAV